MKKSQTFGQALEALQNGECVARDAFGWNGSFVFRQVPAAIKKEIVPGMQSLPAAVKAEFQKRFEDPNRADEGIFYNNQLARVGKSNTISGYSPSAEDALAVDWIIFEKDDYIVGHLTGGRRGPQA